MARPRPASLLLLASVVLFAFLQATAVLAAPLTAADVIRMRLEGRQEWEISRLIPHTSLSPSFRRASWRDRPHGRNWHQVITAATEDDEVEAFHLPAYQAHMPAHRVPQRQGQRLDCCGGKALMELARRSWPKHVPGHVVHGWLHTMLDKLSGAGPAAAEGGTATTQRRLLRAERHVASFDEEAME